MRRSIAATATTAELAARPSNGFATIRRVIPYLWPEGESWVKMRVVIAMVLLLAAKGVSVITPYFYKKAVDALGVQGNDTATWIGLGAIGITVAYGLARMSTVAFGELRDAVFVRVGQRALRKLALETFTHIHRLSMRYHITRKTGGLSRIIERGVKGVDFLLRFMLFSIGPLILELTLVAAIFAFYFGWLYMVVVLVTIAALRHLHLPDHRMARARPPQDEREGHRRQPEGDRQPAELRDGEVFQRRRLGGRRATTRRCRLTRNTR